MNDNLLLQYMNRFAGYGNLDGNFWLIGMDEGGGATAGEIEKKICAWENNGRQTLEDLRLHHEQMGERRWFEKQTRLQPTWNKLIRIIHGIKGLSPQKEDIRDYQENHLGRLYGETCLAELMPLPALSSGDWSYPGVSSLSELNSREDYMRFWGGVRLQALASLINRYRPRNIVYYGLGYYRKWWSQLMPANHEEISIDGVSAYMGKKGGTVFAVSPHPVVTGVEDTFFHGLGRAMREARA